MTGEAKLEIPIFPLPNLVLFPGVTVGLHVFEPRYKRMVADCLEEDSVLGVVLLSPGWQADYEGNPETCRVGSAGRITHYQKLEDGRYDLSLGAFGRFLIEEYLPSELPYRRARVRLIPEAPAQVQEEAALKSDFQSLLLSLGQAGPQEALPNIQRDELSFEQVVNHLCGLVDLSPPDRQKLLQQNSIGERGRAVREVLRERLALKKLVDRYGHLRPSGEDIQRN